MALAIFRHQDIPPCTVEGNQLRDHGIPAILLASQTTLFESNRKSPRSTTRRLNSDDNNFCFTLLGIPLNPQSIECNRRSTSSRITANPAILCFCRLVFLSTSPGALRSNAVSVALYRMLCQDPTADSSCIGVFPRGFRQHLCRRFPTSTNSASKPSPKRYQMSCADC